MHALRTLRRAPAFTATAVIALALLSSIQAFAAGAAITAHPTAAPSNIVVGFVGGFVRHDSPRHGPVKLAQRIRQMFFGAKDVGDFH